MFSWTVPVFYATWDEVICKVKFFCNSMTYDDNYITGLQVFFVYYETKHVWKCGLKSHFDLWYEKVTENKKTHI